MLQIDWKEVTGGIIVGAALGILGTIGWSVAEARRRINFSAKNVYYGPALLWNLFMGGSYPSDDAVELNCEVSFFSNKSLQTGLHNFRLEFCRTTYAGKRPEFVTTEMWRDLGKEGVPHTLDALELPPRQFASFHLRASFGREHWGALRSCDFARLVCETPEGKTRRFPIGPIRFPDMPPDGLRGIELMSVQFMPKSGRMVIMAQRRDTRAKPFDHKPPPEDIRYWNGEGWVHSESQAKVYDDPKVGRSEGEKIKIWDLVPAEWQQGNSDNTMST